MKAEKSVPKSDFISKGEMKNMLAIDFNPSKLEEQLKNCCSEHAKCSDDLSRLAQGIEELYKMRPAQFADRVAGME